MCRLDLVGERDDPGRFREGHGEGVDVEAWRDAALAAELAPRIASPAERAWLAADPGPRFTRLWTRKEALLKRSGEGLVDELDAVDALGSQDLISFAVDAGHVGALAHAPGMRPVWCEGSRLLR